MTEAQMVEVRCETCGIYISLDSSTVKLKNALHKPTECPSCRNSRVAREIELTEMLFRGEEEETQILPIREARKQHVQALF
ncbi:MAG: hypothetical protein KIY12_02215 [Thermoplasmata archaeon]|uniref:Uncharacterized protein n=1 Tax=Candidatus Sysuiplasma superficiale TaxID=2823368 RepID=A0A8J7YSY7_9ARCH|nr:hypothetical protein [Candidatus Sysuiplasma superficiale]MBX8643532.1 hypothetical protein [Candidatus Sysuiplasma superficiale]